MLSITDKKKRIDILLLLSVFVVSYVIYYIGIDNTLEAYDSDVAYYAIAGKDIMLGNILLKGWYGSTNTFYFLSLIYGIVGKILGYRIELIYIVSALVWAVMVTIVSYFTMSLSNGKNQYVKLFMALAILYSSCYLYHGSKIWGGVHLDAMLLGFVYIWHMHRVFDENYKSKIWMSVSALFLFLAIFSDKLVLYFLVFPVILVIIGKLVFEKNSKDRKIEYFKFLVITSFVVVLERVFSKCLEIYGGIQVVWDSNTISFVEQGHIFDRIRYFIAEILYTFGMDFLGKTISIENYGMVVKLLFFMIIIVAFCINIKQILKSTFNQILFTVLLTISAILIFTSYVLLDDLVSYTSRLMYGFLISAILLIVQVDFLSIENKFSYNINEKFVKIIIMIGAIIVLAISISSITFVRKSDEDNTYQKVVKILEEKNLNQGYGTFWLSNVITLASDCKVYVNPVCNSRDLSKFNWLSFDTARWEYANFVLVNEDTGNNWDNITRDTIVESVGEPDEEVRIDDVILMIWNKNIMPYIDGSGSDEDIDYWCSLDDDGTKTLEVNKKHFASWFEATEMGEYISRGEGMLIYGPYMSMKEGIYNITFQYTYDSLENDDELGYVDVYSKSDKISYCKKDLKMGDNSVTISNVAVYERCIDAELRAYAYVPGLTITGIIIEKIG